MIKSHKHVQTFTGGMDRDTAVTKYPNNCYFDALNFRIISDESTSSGILETVKGNDLRLTFATGDTILGYCKIRNNFNNKNCDSIVFFTHNVLGPTSRIYLFEGDPTDFNSTLNMNQAFPVTDGNAKFGYIYRNSSLGFDPNYPIKAEGRYESDNIRKIYWVDNKNNNRYMILDRVSITDPVSIFELNPNADLVQPTATSSNGGSYKSGLVQYSYQLYVKNGARTTFAPCSNIVTLSGGDAAGVSAYNQGTSMGVNTGKSCEITISSLDPAFDRIRIVALYYTEFNVNPVVNVVAELEYNSAISDITFTDNGYTIYDTVPLELFRTLGQFDIKSDSIASKNNYLFLGNVSKSRWNPIWLDPTDPTFWDARAVRFRKVTSTASASSAEISSTYTQGISTDIFMERGSGDSTLKITIYNFSSFISLPVGRTITTVTGFSSDGGGTGNAVHSGIWHDVVDTINPFSSTVGNTTFNLDSYNPGTDTLIFNAVTSDTAYFGVGYDHVDTCQIKDIVYTYEYTYISSNDAVVDDAIEGPVTIDAPTGNTPAEWDAANWTDYVYYHDGINDFNDISNDADPDYEFKYQMDSATLGASGKNIKIEFVTDSLKLDQNTTTQKSYVSAPYAGTAIDTYKRSSLRNEVYRIYVVFYNTKLQFTDPQWVIDLRMPTVGESLTIDEATEIYAKYLYPKITLYNLPADTDLYGWQVFRCERNSSDKSVLMRGLISTLFYDGATYSKLQSSKDAPYMFIRAEDGAVVSTDNVIEFVAPEITFDKFMPALTANDIIRIDGRYLADDDDVAGDGGTEFHSYYMKTVDSKAPSATDTLTYTIDELTTMTGTDPSLTFYSQIKGEQVENRMHHTIGSEYYSRIGTTMLVGLTSDITVDGATTGYLMASYMRNVANSRYGGITYEARSFNRVIPYSEFNLISTDNVRCEYGDTFIGYYTFMRGMIPDMDTVKRFQQTVNIAVETCIDLARRLDPIQAYIDPKFGATYCTYAIQEKVADGTLEFSERYPLELGDLYRQNKVYSQVGTAQTIQCKVFDSNNIETIDVEIIAAGPKVNNEYFDTWTDFNTNNLIWLDPKYGAIRNIFTINNSLYAAQDRAIAQVAVQERSMLQDMSKKSLLLGIGGVLDRYDYVTTTSGAQNYYDMVLSDKSFYYVDRKGKIIYALANEGTIPISEIKGIRSLMKGMRPITTVKTGYDPLHKEVLFYVSDDIGSFTIAYNEYLNAFTSFYSIPDSGTPDWSGIMFNLNNEFYTTVGHSCYEHNHGSIGKFYGVEKDAYVISIINPLNTSVCRFDVLDTRVDVMDAGGSLYEKLQFDYMEFYNNYQVIAKNISFGAEPAVLDTSKTVARQWRTWIIPDDGSTESYRMVDTYLRILLYKTNGVGSNMTTRLHDLTLYVRPIRN